MAGTIEGGKKAAATNKARYGEDFYRVQGAKGGKGSNTGGFAANPELARIAGKKGGRNSSRAGIKNGEGKKHRPTPQEVETFSNRFISKYLPALKSLASK